ncbi:MAG: hypothetical protein ABFS17_07485 [Chloroflexota bacterium]
MRKRGLHQFAAAFLEASGPLNLVGAQLVFLGQPVLSSMLAGSKLTTLAHMLEEPEQTELFIRCLREDSA